MFNFHGKVALVTGGGQGIGKGLCQHLSQAGANIVVIDINADKAEKTANELTDSGNKALAITADVTDKSQLLLAMQTIHHCFGRLDIAINNAGVGANSPAEDTSLNEWNRILDVNLTGVFLSCQAEFSLMKTQQYGKIINIASMSSIVVPHPQKQAAYNASKAAVVQLTKSLACEWAQHRINVNALSPGIVETGMINTSALAPLVKEWLHQIPLNRLAKISDLYSAISFLASDESSYMVGHNLVVDGGQSIW